MTAQCHGGTIPKEEKPSHFESEIHLAQQLSFVSLEKLLIFF